MLNDIQKELIEYGKISGSKGYTPGISGNMSCRFDDGIVIIPLRLNIVGDLHNLLSP